MIKDKSCLFKDIIEDMKNIYLEFGDEKLIEDDDWCIYTVEEKLEPDTECYVFDYPDYDDETGEEILFKTLKHLTLPLKLKCFILSCMQSVVISQKEQHIYKAFIIWNKFSALKHRLDFISLCPFNLFNFFVLKLQSIYLNFSFN